MYIVYRFNIETAIFSKLATAAVKVYNRTEDMTVIERTVSASAKNLYRGEDAMSVWMSTGIFK